MTVAVKPQKWNLFTLDAPAQTNGKHLVLLWGAVVIALFGAICIISIAPIS